jgi:hypothetical protein
MDSRKTTLAHRSFRGCCLHRHGSDERCLEFETGSSLFNPPNTIATITTATNSSNSKRESKAGRHERRENRNRSVLESMGMASWPSSTSRRKSPPSPSSGSDDASKMPQNPGLDVALAALHHETTASLKVFRALVQSFNVDTATLREWASDRVSII